MYKRQDYIQYYSDLIRDCGAEVEVILANDPRAVLPYTKKVLACDIHTRARTKRLLKAAGAEIVYGLDDLMTQPVNGSGCNEQYGLLGSNKSNEDTVKLFPRACQGLVEEIQAQVLAKTGAHVEVMVYGDGAFKDPVGKIWELADPCVGVAYTAGLEGTPNELKLKYLADNDFKDLSGDALKAVSYTHLDVYKRQGYYTDEEFEAKCKQYDYATPFTKESLLLSLIHI